VCDAANSAYHNQSIESNATLYATDDVAWSVCLSLCVHNGDNHCKTAEPIEMPFGSDCLTCERAILGVDKHGHARSVYKEAQIFGATMRTFVKLL